MSKGKADKGEALRAAIRADFTRACETLYLIEPRDGTGLKHLVLWPEQQKQVALMQAEEKAGRPVRILRLKARQAGDSTLAQAWLFHKASWTPRQRCLTVAHDDETTSRLFDMSKLFYNELPPELQVPTEKLSRRELVFKAPHGSLLSAQTAGWAGLGHGRTFQFLHLSEVDRWVDPVTSLDGLLPTCPNVAGTTIIMESVAEHPDGFLRGFWDASKRKETGYLPLFTPWFEVPVYRSAVPDDFPPLGEEEEALVAKHGLTLEQIAWYRQTLALFVAKEPWGGERKMRRLFPSSDVEAFQASGLCIFPDVVLNRIRDTLCRPALSFKLVPTGGGDIVDVPVQQPEEADLWVWESPQAECLYSLGVDVSDGVGATESVVEVFRYPDYVQVAEWASDRTSPEQTAWVVRFLAEKYGGGQCLVVPEINKSGVLVLHILQNMPGGFGIFRWRYLNRPGQAETNNPALGWECVDPDARILTADLRWVRAEQIKVGDRIMGCFETSRRPATPLRMQVVTDTRTFIAPMVEVALADGRRTRVSTTHPFWVGRASQPCWKWIMARDLRVGDQVKCLPVWDELRTYEAGRLSGFLDGEGHLSQGRRYGMHLLITQAVGPTAEEIRELWRINGFTETFKWLRHKDRPREKDVTVCGVTRAAEVFRALGSLRPTRLLRTFAERVDVERLSLNSLESVAVAGVRFIGEGLVVGLTTSPDHTLIADGIVGHNTNARTKSILAQVANQVFLRATKDEVSGVVRSHVLHDQMKRCVDLVPGRRWTVERGKSDRVLATMLALVGAYLDFEGGEVDGMGAGAESRRAEDRTEPPRERNAVDTEWDSIIGASDFHRGHYLQEWDTLPR